MQEELKTVMLIVFKISNYLLALPISDVLKVVNLSPLADSQLRTMGIVQLGKYVIRVLDLHERFSSDGLAQLDTSRDFLVITRTPEGQLCGIGVDEPPNLMELPLESIKSLPKSEHLSGGLELVSHTAVISDAEIKKTVFLLNSEQLVT